MAAPHGYTFFHFREVDRLYRFDPALMDGYVDFQRTSELGRIDDCCYLYRQGYQEEDAIMTVEDIRHVVEFTPDAPDAYGYWIPLEDTVQWADLEDDHRVELDSILLEADPTFGTLKKTEMLFLPEGFQSGLQADLPFRLAKAFIVLEGEVSVQQLCSSIFLERGSSLEIPRTRNFDRDSASAENNISDTVYVSAQIEICEFVSLGKDVPATLPIAGDLRKAALTDAEYQEVTELGLSTRGGHVVSNMTRGRCLLSRTR